MMKRAISPQVWVGLTLMLMAGCTDRNELISQTNCDQAIAIATQTWEVDYYLSKASSNPNQRRTQAFAHNQITNLNGTKPDGAIASPDDQGIWWPPLPPRPSADEVDQARQPGELFDPPQLQRSREYRLRCGQRELSTDAALYREASRLLRSGQPVSVTYSLNRALQIQSAEVPKSETLKPENSPSH